MAWRPSDWVLEAELDNTTKGWVTGWILIQNQQQPLKLSLKLVGNCHPDLAGWKFKVVRTEPIPSWAQPLSHADNISPNQVGHAGDITADQELKHFNCSEEEFVHRAYLGEQTPTEWRKALYLEWFSHANGRIVIQSTSLAVERQGERAFELTDEQWNEQRQQNAEEMNFFMTQLGDAIQRQPPGGSDSNNQKHDS